MIKLLHITVTAIAAVFLLWFLSPVLYGVRNVGIWLGVFICAVLIFRFGFSGIYESLKLRLNAYTATAILFRSVQIAACVFAAYAIAVSGFMLYAMNVKPKDDSTAVVLGAQVKPWGPSTLLRQRIDAASGYLKEQSQASAVLTGGQGNDEVMSEAQCMYESLIGDGIAAERLYPEDQAKNTEENILFSFRIIKDKGLKREVAIVTDGYHQLRARIIAAKTDPSVRVSAVNTKNNLIGLSAFPSYFVREWIAIPAEILKGISGAS